jgi:DNA-binding PucR family transcriptional regulator
MNEITHFSPVKPTLAFEFTEKEAEDILGDLPGGQSVSEATRRFHQCLHEARQALKEQRRAAELHPAGIPAPTLMLLDGDTST